MAGRVEDLHPRADTCKPCRQISTAHARHDDISKHQVHWSAVTLQQDQSLPAVSHLEDAVAGRLEDTLRQITDGLLVLDDEDGFGALHRDVTARAGSASRAASSTRGR